MSNPLQGKCPLNCKMSPILCQTWKLIVRVMVELAVVLMLLVMLIDESQTVSYKIPLVYSQSGFKSKRAISSDASRLSNLRGKPGQGYYIAVDIGTPPQRLNVLIDTGSSNFAIASFANPFIQRVFHPNESTTFRENGTQIYVPYTQGKWEGLLGSDIVTIPSVSHLSVRVDLACITKSEKFFLNGSNWHGILGLAYPSIARPNSSVTPFFNTLVGVKHVSNVFSLQLCGETADLNSIAGTMIVGGIDPSLYSGEITYAPVRREWYYEVVLARLEVGDIPVQIDCKELNTDKTIVDSGTTNLRLPRKVFAIVVDMLKRQVNEHYEKIPEDFWSGDSAMCWVSGVTPINVFPRLRISVAHSRNETFVLSIPPQQYLREFRGDFTSGRANCFKFAINPSDSGTVLGTVVMEGFYLIFDRQNRRIGFAQSSCRDRVADQNIRSVILGPFPSSDPMRCSYVPPTAPNSRTLVYVAYIMAGFCGLGLIPLVLVFIKWTVVAKKRSSDNTADTNSLFDGDEVK